MACAAARQGAEGFIRQHFGRDQPVNGTSRALQRTPIPHWPSFLRTSKCESLLRFPMLLLLKILDHHQIRTRCHALAEQDGLAIGRDGQA